MKQSAVEWLIDELNNIKVWTKNDIILSKADILIDQAKEMEKQQQGYSEEKVYNLLEQIGKSEFLQKLRATKSDAEARRLIFETFKKK